MMHDISVSPPVTDSSVYEKLDKEAHRAYVMKICANLSELTQPAEPRQPPNLIVDFWEKSLSTTKLVLEHFASSQLIKPSTELSEIHSNQQEINSNLKQLRAMCKKGNQRW